MRRSVCAAQGVLWDACAVLCVLHPVCSIEAQELTSKRTAPRANLVSTTRHNTSGTYLPIPKPTHEPGRTHQRMREGPTLHGHKVCTPASKRLHKPKQHGSETQEELKPPTHIKGGVQTESKTLATHAVDTRAHNNIENARQTIRPTSKLTA
jgi:hypothetical protein